MLQKKKTAVLPEDALDMRKELSDDELEQVSGGHSYDSIICPGCDNYTATYYYANKKCVMITCPCGYFAENQNGL